MSCLSESALFEYSNSPKINLVEFTKGVYLDEAAHNELPNLDLHFESF